MMTGDMLEDVYECPVCGSGSCSVFYEDLVDTLNDAPGKWKMMLCSDCQCGYLNPRFSVGHIHLAYQNYHTHTLPAKTTDKIPTGWKKVWIKLRNGYLNNQYGWRFPLSSHYGRFLVPYLPGRKVRCGHLVKHFILPVQGGRLLDIGCGSGFFLRFALTGGWQAEGLDPDPEAARTARERGLPVRVGGLPETGYEENSFNAVTLNHVIEHLHDPVESLREVLRILKPGGLATVSTPNIESWSHYWFKRNWRGLEPPRHIVLFSKYGIQSMCKHLGFEILGLHRSPPNARYYLWLSEEIARRFQKQVPMGKVRHFILRIIATGLDKMIRLWPTREEEIVLVLRKPVINIRSNQKAG